MPKHTAENTPGLAWKEIDKEFRIGQTVMLKWSGLKGIVEDLTDSHAFLRFADNSTGSYVFSCLVGLQRESSNVYSRREHRSA